MVPRTELIAWLNGISWMSPVEVTPLAESLIAQHLSLIKAVVDQIVINQEISIVEAHGIAQTAGHDTQEGQDLLDSLFRDVSFRGAVVRTALIANIAAAYCWHLDSELSEMQNPWKPLMDLYGLGYTVSTEDEPDWNSINLMVGYAGGTKEYKIS